MKVGDVFPMDDDATVGDCVVIRVLQSPRTVTVVDELLGEVFLYTYEDDGIRVQVRVVNWNEGLTESKWLSVPITLCPPPPKVAEFLRRR